MAETTPAILQPPLPDVWQGDVFDDVPLAAIRRLRWVAERSGNVLQPCDGPSGSQIGQVVVSATRGRGMLLNHECRVENGHGEPVAFARV